MKNPAERVGHEYLILGTACATMFAISITLARIAWKIATTPTKEATP